MKRWTIKTLLLALTGIGLATTWSGGISGAIAAPLTLNRQLQTSLNNGTRGPDRDEADNLVRLGMEQQQMGNLEQAIAVWLVAKEIYHQLGDLQAVGQTYNHLGSAYRTLDRYTEAEDAIRRGLSIARDRQDFPTQITSLNNLGTLLLQRDSASAAQRTFLEALILARNIQSPQGQGLTLSNLGLTAVALGEPDVAVDRYQESLKFRRQAGDRIGEANTQNNLADLYLQQQKYNDAIAAYGMARRLGQVHQTWAPDDSTSSIAVQYRALDGLIAAHRALQQYSPALELAQERLTLAQTQPDPRQEMIAWQALANLYGDLGNQDSAQQAYTKALTLAESLQDNGTAATVRQQMEDVRFKLSGR